MSKKLILFVGNMGCGKTTASNILKKYGFVEKTFAEPLKEFACSIGFTKKQIHGSQQEKNEINEFWGISGREFMQKFGTEVCRQLLPKCIPNMQMNEYMLWSRAIEQNIQKFPLTVISDGRFADEAQLIKKYNGVIIRLLRDRIDMPLTTMQHDSEQQLMDIKYDYEINNNGTTEELEHQLCKILKSEGLFLVPLVSNAGKYNICVDFLSSAFNFGIRLGISAINWTIEQCSGSTKKIQSAISCGITGVKKYWKSN